VGGRARQDRAPRSADIAKDPELLKEMQVSIDELNARLNKWETIKKFEILDRDFTVEELAS
jgi:long-chain acyl-CoA synthetase